MWPKLKTLLLVVVLSCLIWVFAEREVTKEIPVSVTIDLVSHTNDLLVQYLDENNIPQAESYRKVTLIVKGPTGKIQAINKDYPTSITLDVQKLGYIPQDQSKDYRSPVIALVDRLYSRNRESFLQVIDTEPKDLDLHFRVTKLVLKPFPVNVYGPNKDKLNPEIISPAEVEAYVPAGVLGEAKIVFNEQQISAAIQIKTEFTVEVTPLNRVKNNKVIVKLSEGGNLKLDKIRNPRLGIIKPYALEGKYKVVIDGSTRLDEYSPIECRGTSQALEEYNKRYHLILEISEEDEQKPSLQFDRLPIYNLPEGYGQIEILNKKQVTIGFHLEKIADK